MGSQIVKLSKITTFILVLFLLMSFVLADTNVYSVYTNYEEQIQVQENSNWYYFNLTKHDGTNDYLGVSKTQSGRLGFGVEDEYIGYGYLVPAFQHPSNSRWYLCPLVNIGSVTKTLTNNSMQFTKEKQDVTCYRYDDTSITATANLNISIYFTASSFTDYTVRNKMNISVNDISPLDTGFAYSFKPNDYSKFRKVYLGGSWTDINGSVGAVSQQYGLKFGDENNNPISHVFDWSDMPNGTFFSEIISIGSNKHLLVGTYGYGASNTIEIDPVFNVTNNVTFPSYHLKNGTNDIDTRTDYANWTEVSAELSDDDAGTNFTIKLGEDIFDGNLFFGYTINEIQGDVLNDFSEENNDFDLLGTYDLTTNGTEYTGIRLYGDANGVATTSTDFDIGANESALICLSFNTSTDVIGTQGILERRIHDDGYYIRMLSNERIRCVFDRGTQVAQSDSTNSRNDGRWHKVCCYSNATSGSNILYIDGVERDRDAGDTGDIVNTDNLYLGSENGGNYFNGSIDEVCGWKTDQIFNPADIVARYNQTLCINETLGHAIQPFFNHTMKPDDENYSLKITGDFQSVTLVRIWIMLNDTDINTTNYLDAHLSGKTSFVDINNLIYQDYDQPFRVATLNTENQKLYDIYLYEIMNDTGAPSINSCSWDDISVDCDDFSTLTCNVTDDNGVQSVTDFLFAPTDSDPFSSTNLTDSTPLINVETDLWQKNHSPADFSNLLDSVGWKFRERINFSITQVNATDVIGNVNSTDYAVNTVYVEYTCIDINAPSVFNTHVDGTNHTFADVVHLGVNATDDVTVNTVFANITYPNSTELILTLPFISNNEYKENFTTPSLAGRYNVTYFANDTNNNINYTETTYFIGVDNVAPADIQNLINISQDNQSVYVEWLNPSDTDFNYTEVWYNESGGSLTFFENVSNPSNSSNITELNNNTIVTIQVRPVDTTGNLGNYSLVTTTTHQNILSEINITLVSPNNGSTITTTPTIFSYNISSFNSLNICELILNNVTKQNSTNITNNAVNNFLQSVSEGSINWYVNCTDNVGFIQKSGIFTNTVSFPSVPSTGTGSPSLHPEEQFNFSFTPTSQNVTEQPLIQIPGLLTCEAFGISGKFWILCFWEWILYTLLLIITIVTVRWIKKKKIFDRIYNNIKKI